MENKKNGDIYRTSIGGQALIEGIMMRGPQKQAIVVRKCDGSLLVKEEQLKFIKDRYPILGWPLIRGTANFLSSMIDGVKALTYSAEQMPEEDQEPESKFDLWVERKFGTEKANKIIIGIAVIMGIALAIGLFVLLPTILTGFVSGIIKSSILKNLIEGVVRIVIFLVYLWLATRMKEVKRMFEYHGAEHKSIHCYEKGLELTVENVRPQPRQHPRCGTSFLFVVMIISMLVLLCITWTNIWMRIGLRLLLIPVIVGISYEINRWVGRHDNWLSAMLAAPGKALQHLTVFEPDDSMIEVAIEALKRVIPEQAGDDRW